MVIIFIFLKRFEDFKNVEEFYKKVGIEVPKVKVKDLNENYQENKENKENSNLLEDPKLI
jgi:hypothetical protein